MNSTQMTFNPFIQNTQHMVMIIALCFIQPTLAQDNDLEIPVLEIQSMHFNEADPSSDPELMWRQFEYTSAASVDQLLQFYRDSDFIKSCDYNEMADNYICQLKQHGQEKSGQVFVPRTGPARILADYFYFKEPQKVECSWGFIHFCLRQK